MEVRFRQLANNTGTPAVFDNAGTLFLFNGSTNTNIGALGNKSFALTGPFVPDTFEVMLTPEPTGEWQVLTIDFSNAPNFNSSDITAMRFDPVGAVTSKNFQVDYIRVTAVPEPASFAAMVAVGGWIAARSRRRRP